MRIGLIGDNSLEFVEKLLEIWSMSDCAVIIDWRMPFAKIDELLIEAKVSLCYIEKGLIENGIVTPIHYITFVKSPNNMITKLPQNIIEKYKASYSSEEALILYSSGTTGRCKGIILSYYAITTNADMIMSYMELSSNDAIYIMKSLSHSSTIVGELLVALKSLCNIYLSATIIPPKLTLDQVEKLEITTLCLNPSLLKLYCEAEKKYNHHFSKLGAVYVSGSYLDPKTIEDFKIIFGDIPLLNVYGLTEAGPRVTAQTLNDNNVIGSVGKPIGQVQVKIENCFRKENIGLIKVKTPSCFQGYISGQAAKIDMDGWINTGDIGYLDTDGNLFVIGRHDNMMLVGSHNVFPEDIENYLMRSGLIDDCIVYSTFDSINGEKVVCKYTSPKEVRGELYEYCSKGLAPYEMPKEFQHVDRIETTYNGKKRRLIYGN